MRHRLRLISLILIVVFIFSLIACSIPKTTGPETTAEITTQIEEIETTNTTIENNSIKYGLTETQRKQAYYDLATLQDSIALEDPPDRGEQMVKAYSTVAEKYGITKDEMMEITAEGMEKNWPMPPLE